MYLFSVVRFSMIMLVMCFTLVIIVGSFLIPREVHAESQVVATLSERDRLLLQTIQQLQEVIVILQRKLTTIQGQKEGENLINENSIAETNERIQLYAGPNYLSEVLAKQSKGQWGEVSAGPKLVAQEVWWRFKFQDGTEGWSPESKLTRMPSTVVSFPYEENGEQKWSQIRFIGEYDPNGFVAEPSEEGTFIRYKGEVIEPYEVTEL